MRPLHWVATHTAVCILGALVVAAWLGWHRPPIQVVEKTVLQQAPGAAPSTFNVTLPGGVLQVPQVVFTPPNEPNVRVITVPAPAVVSPKEKAAAQAAAPLVVEITLKKVCVHPDTAGIPDPTCGAPVAPTITAVQKADHTGFIVVQDPNEALSTQIGQTTTRETGINQAGREGHWRFRVGAAGITSGPSGAAFQAQYNFASFLFAQGTVIGGGTGGLGGMFMVGIEF